jgi:aminopeptidase N
MNLCNASFRRSFNCFLIILVISACKPSKKQTATPVLATSNEPTILMDTVEVLANKPAEKEVYHGSNRRLNDIIHTRLDVSFNWNEATMDGKATLTVKPYFYPVNMLYLNARGMTIKSLSVYELVLMEEAASNKRTKSTPTHTTIAKQVEGAKHSYRNDSILIELGRTFKSSEEYQVVVEYVSKPNELKSGGSSAITDDKGLYFINPKGENPFKMPQIWTQGETQASSVWFPTIDSPNERMTQEIFMTVDEKYTTLSNGSLVNSVKNGNGSLEA